MRKREVSWDHRKSRKNIHVGKVSVFFRRSSWHIYYRENGKAHRVRIGPERNEAEKRAAEVNAQLACGVPSSYGFERVSVEELVRLWLEHHDLVLRSSVSTVRRYRSAVEHLLRFIREKRPRLTADAFGPPVVEEFVKSLRTRKVSPNGHPKAKKRPLRDKGVIFVLGACRSLFNYAARQRHLPPYARNPFAVLVHRTPQRHILCPPSSRPQAPLAAVLDARAARVYSVQRGENAMHDSSDIEKLPLPKGWPAVAKSSILHAVSLASTAFKITIGRQLDSPMPIGRDEAQRQRDRTEIELAREELRLVYGRLSRFPPRKRPHYTNTERMRILELQAKRGWSKAETARHFLVEPETIADWRRRIDEAGVNTLVATSEPVNKYPAFVAYLVQTLAALWPEAGKKRLAQVFGRAGLHIGVTTAGRMRAGKPTSPPQGAKPGDPASAGEEEKPPRKIIADYPVHVVHVDLTVVPTLWGFWSSLSPFALPQIWPFCWWVVFVEDHFSRRALGFALFFSKPTSLQVRTSLGRAFDRIGNMPKYIISDRDSIFDCDANRAWCKRKHIKPRYGAVGKHGSIAVIERFIRSFKDEFARRVDVPLRLAKMQEESKLYLVWYNQFRTHQTLNGRTPDEVFFDREPANEKSRWEPRKKWPRKTVCAAPWAAVKGRRAAKAELRLSLLEGRKYLPVVELTWAA